MIGKPNCWTSQNGKSTFHLQVPIHELANRLKEGCILWGGGAGVHRREVEGEQVTYACSHPTEDGHDGTEYFTSPEDAVWAYLKYVGGHCMINLVGPNGVPL